MRPITLTASNTDANGVVARVNYRERNFKIGFVARITAAAPTYSVQVTFDDPQQFGPSNPMDANANWVNHDTVVGETTDQTGNIAFPVQAIRLIVTAGTGTVEGIFLQAG